MNIYKLGEDTFAIIDNYLWKRIEPATSDQGVLIVKTREKNGRGQRKGSLSNEQIQKLQQDFQAGMKRDEIAKKYGVSPATVYNYSKGQAIKKQRQAYQCDMGHRFTSNLPMLDAKCPTCKSTNIERQTEMSSII